MISAADTLSREELDDLMSLSRAYLRRYHGRGIGRLARALGVTIPTLDRIVTRSRRVRPSTMARVRARLRAATEARQIVADAIADLAIETALGGVARAVR